MLGKPQDDDFDLKFAPEFAGQATEEEVDDEEYEDGEEYEEEEEYEENDDEDSEEEDDEEYEDDEEEETVPIKQHKELRKFATQKAMELAAIKKQLLESAAAPKTQEAPQAKPNENPLRQPMDELISSKVNERLEELLAPIREQEEELALQTSIFTIAENDDDFSEVAPLFMEQIEANPEILSIKGGVELAYRAAKADYQTLVQAARIKAEAQALAQRRAMKKTVTDGASYTRPKQGKARSEADIIKEQIMSIGSRKTFE